VSGEFGTGSARQNRWKSLEEDEDALAVLKDYLMNTSGQ